MDAATEKLTAATAVCVHGIGNKPPVDCLKAAWDIPLFGQAMAERTRTVYWADLRYEAPLQCDQPEEALLPAVLPQSTDTPTPETLREEISAALPESGPFGRLADKLAVRAYDLAVDDPPVATQAADFLPTPLRVILFREIAKRFIGDAHAYFFGGRGEDVRDRLRAVLRDVHGPLVVIGHSLGSVICYDVLSEREFEELDVRLFVTLGSPLGITEIQDVIEQPLRIPGPVRSWANYADNRDLVALDFTLSEEYEVRGRILDYLVVNRDVRSAHGLTGYLETESVRGAIRPLFGM